MDEVSSVFKIDGVDMGKIVGEKVRRVVIVEVSKSISILRIFEIPDNQFVFSPESCKRLHLYLKNLT